MINHLEWPIVVWRRMYGIYPLKVVCERVHVEFFNTASAESHVTNNLEPHDTVITQDEI